jgi:NAD(P)H dehydrogenase (quinone)
MAKVLVLYYSAYGHIETMANAVAEGAREAGAKVDIKRVPEIVPEEMARAAHFKLNQAAPLAKKLMTWGDYDAVIIGAGTRVGRLSSQMASFLDQAGGLWMRGALHGKVGGAFTSTGTQHGAQETTLFNIITNLFHFGMVIVGLDTGTKGKRPFKRSRVVRRTARRRLPEVTVRVSRPPTSWPGLATRGDGLQRSPTNCMASASR